MDPNIVGRLCQTPAPINSTTDQTDITDIVKEAVAAASARWNATSGRVSETDAALPPDISPETKNSAGGSGRYTESAKICEICGSQCVPVSRSELT